MLAHFVQVDADLLGLIGEKPSLAERLFQPDLPEAERQQAVRATLAQHEGSPEHIARTVLYLIDNDFVTGSCLTVDGGRTVYAAGN